MVSSDVAERERFVVLDGMRGLAALVVITDHVASETLRTLLPGRYLAVDFFFVLSGFVLAHVYADRLRTKMSPLGFMRARLIRLYPLYLFAAGMGAVLALIFALKGWGEATPATVLSAAVFAILILPCPPGPSWNVDEPFPLNGPSWSLFFELVINVVFALVARWLTPRLCLWFMAAGAVGLVATAFSFGRLDVGFAWSNFVGGFPRVTFEFFAGVWLYQIRAHERVPAAPAWAAYAALVGVFMAPAGPTPGFGRAVADLIAAMVLLPALVVVSANAHARTGLLKISAVVGMLSYGVYVLHVPLWNWIRVVLERFALDLPGWGEYVLVAGAVLTFAALLNAFYDVPVRRLLGGVGRKRGGAA